MRTGSMAADLWGNGRRGRAILLATLTVLCGLSTLLLASSHSDASRDNAGHKATKAEFPNRFGARIGASMRVQFGGGTATSGSRPWTAMAYNYGFTGAIGGHKGAPRDGVLNKIRLFPASGGRFRLQLAEIRGRTKYPCSPDERCISRLKITRKVGRIKYPAEKGFDPDTDTHQIRTIQVPNTKVRKGEILAFTSIGPRLKAPVQCRFGKNNLPTMQLQPALQARDGFILFPRQANGPFTGAHDGFISCQMMVQAIMTH